MTKAELIERMGNEDRANWVMEEILRNVNEREEKQKEYEATHEHRYEDTAEYGFDLFWKYVNGEIEDL